MNPRFRLFVSIAVDEVLLLEIIIQTRKTYFMNATLVSLYLFNKGETCLSLDFNLEWGIVMLRVEKSTILIPIQDERDLDFSHNN